MDARLRWAGVHNYCNRNGGVAQDDQIQQPGNSTHFLSNSGRVPWAGPLCEDAVGLLRDLGRRLSEFSGDVREVQFLYQRISVVVQRFNAVLLAARQTSLLVDEQPE